MQQEDKWYQNGLPFECTGCGKCCTGAPGVVWISDEEMQAMSQLLGLSVSQFAMRYLRRIDGKLCLVEKRRRCVETQEVLHDCIFLKDNKCQVYSARPTQCRTYPWWALNLKDKESWERAAKDCEGIHPDAKNVPFEEIEARLKENS